MRPFVVFELNEVPWRILDWWTGRHPRSALAQALPAASQWTTVAADDGHLSPWVTWPTVHRGVPNTAHGIAHFGQSTEAADRAWPAWWRLAVDGGRTAGVFGLLHTSPLPADVRRYRFWVPDAFAPEPQTHPASLEPFQRFNLTMARASARNVSTAIDLPGALRFLATAPGLGVRPATARTLARQLLDERQTPHRRVRRRSLQSVVAFDLFAGQLRRTRPDAAAFFTNHVASALHRYWAATFPGDYPPEEYQFDAEWAAQWDDEIDAALTFADGMVGRLVRWSHVTGGRLVVMSSMGQQAAQGTPVERQLYLRDPARLLAVAGIDPGQWDRRPAMDPQVNIELHPDAVAPLLAWLDRVAIGGQPIERSVAGTLVSLSFGQANDAIGRVTVDGEVVAPEELGLVTEDIEDMVASTGYHVPEGSLWLYDPLRRTPGDGRSERPEVPTTAIAPALLALLGLDPAPHHRDAGVLDLQAWV